MIPNLTLIVGVYCFVRLAALALRQFPKIGESIGARVGLVAGAVVAIALITICTLDTIGVGLSVGSSIDAKQRPGFPH